MNLRRTFQDKIQAVAWLLLFVLRFMVTRSGKIQKIEVRQGKELHELKAGVDEMAVIIKAMEKLHTLEIRQNKSCL